MVWGFACGLVIPFRDFQREIIRLSFDKISKHGKKGVFSVHLAKLKP